MSQPTGRGTFVAAVTSVVFGVMANVAASAIDVPARLKPLVFGATIALGIAVVVFETMRGRTPTVAEPEREPKKPVPVATPKKAAPFGKVAGPRRPAVARGKTTRPTRSEWAPRLGVALGLLGIAAAFYFFILSPEDGQRLDLMSEAMEINTGTVTTSTRNRHSETLTAGSMDMDGSCFGPHGDAKLEFKPGIVSNYYTIDPGGVVTALIAPLADDNGPTATETIKKASEKCQLAGHNARREATELGGDASVKYYFSGTGGFKDNYNAYAVCSGWFILFKAYGPAAKTDFSAFHGAVFANLDKTMNTKCYKAIE